MARKLAEHTLNHLDFNVGDRGKWRKYNPYNPYVDESENPVKNDLKVESLDDLFEDEPQDNKNEIKVENNITDNTHSAENEQPKVEEIKPTNEAPVLPQGTEEDEVFSVDVQKELGGKFEELFGPIDDDTDNANKKNN